jgi:hypothetical protein
MAEMDLKEIVRSYEDAQRDFRGLQRKLDAALAPHKPAADAVERILACAEEYGVDPALRRVGTNPDQFGVRLLSQVRKGLRGRISKAYCISPYIHYTDDMNRARAISLERPPRG